MIVLFANYVDIDALHIVVYSKLFSLRITERLPEVYTYYTSNIYDFMLCLWDLMICMVGNTLTHNTIRQRSIRMLEEAIAQSFLKA